MSEITPKEITVSYLEMERGRWLEYRRLADRNAHMSPEANKRESDAMMRLNYLLDELFALNVQVLDGTAI